MKKIRCLLVLMFALSIFFFGNANAKSLLSVYNSSWRVCRGGTFDHQPLYYNNIGIFTKTAEQYLTSKITYVDTNTQINTSFNSSQSCSYTADTSFSFLKATKSNDYLKFEFYNEAGTFETSKFGYTHTFRNGDTVLLNNIWFLHGSFVLYNDDMTHTLQIFPESYGEDFILFTDPLESTMTSAYDNFYVISIPQRKAWGMKLLSQHIDYLFKGLTQNYNVKEFPFTSSYTLTPQFNTTAFPKFTFYMNAQSNYNNGPWDRFSNDTGFIYQKDLEYTPPVWDTDDNNDSNAFITGDYVVPSVDLVAWNNYQACERDYSYRNFIVSSRKACASDYQNQLITAESYHRVMEYVFEYANIRNENTTGDMQEFFSGYDYSSAQGCQGLIYNAQTLVKLYNNLGDPYDFGYYSDVVTELKYISQENPYNITQQCGDRPSVPSQYSDVNNNSNICNMDSWANIINCFSFGSSSSGTGEDDSSYFGLAINNIGAMIVSPIRTNLVDPINSGFNAGINLVNNGVSCNANNVMIDIPYIDYVVYILAGLIVFLLLGFVL